MKLNTATCFIFLSGSLWYQVKVSRFNTKPQLNTYLYIAIPLLLSATTVMEYVFNLNVGIDNLFMTGSISGLDTEFLGRMSQITAVNMLIASLALWLIVTDTKRRTVLAQGFAIIVIWVGLTALSGYFFEVEQLYGLPGYSTISFKTSCLFVLLGLGVLCMRAEKGLMAVITSNLYGSLIIRKILPVLILLPYVVGWTRTWLHEQGWLGVEIGPSIFATTYALIFVGITWVSARKLNVIDSLRHQKENERQQATKQAISEKNFSDMMVESLPGILYFYNEDKHFLRWNKNFEIASGYSKDEIAHMHPLDFFSEDEKELVNQRIEEVFAGGRSFVEANFLSKDGTTTPYFFTGRKVMFEGVDCLVGIGIDIAEQKYAQDQLRVAAIAFEAQEGIAISDSDEVILRVNQAFTKITGYEPHEIIGKKATILKIDHQNDRLYGEMLTALKADDHWQGEVAYRHKDGEAFTVWLTIKAVTNDKGNITHYVSTFSDLTQFKEDEAKIHSLAFYDSLTGLANRRLLYERLHKMVMQSGVKHSYGALLFLDLDNFKILNDTKGHSFGDLLLVKVAKRVQSCLRESDFVARLGGDEFVVLLENLGPNAELASKVSADIGEKILKTMSAPYLLKKYKYHCSVSIGISIYGKKDTTVEELLKRADVAMYQAKNSGRNRLQFYNPEMQAKLELRSVLENDLHRALVEKQFKLHYQKQVYHNGQILAAEVLIRWQHPQGHLIPPNEFISVAEETGLILPIGQWVLDVACEQIKNWETGVNTRLLKLAVNISAVQFHQPNFVKLVKQTINRYNIDPDKLELELTESIVLDNVDDTMVKMKSLRKVGVRFSLDDFGTGYSSLSYLTLLPFDQIKIDQSFIRKIGEAQSNVIVQTIIGMAKNLGMEVIAEGVETELQRQFLEQEGCPVLQGYLFSKPVPIEEFEAMLKES